MGIDKQDLNQAGQPILTTKVCKHGVLQDRRGNSACEECFDEHSHGDYLMGESEGLKAAAAMLMGKAKAAFVEDDSTKAEELKALSKELSGQSRAKRSEWVKYMKEKFDRTYPE
jgi:hypothetical protein